MMELYTFTRTSVLTDACRCVVRRHTAGALHELISRVVDAVVLQFHARFLLDVTELRRRWPLEPVLLFV